MGQDAGIFALKAKKYFWFDRLKNMQGWMYATGADSGTLEVDRAELIMMRMRKPDKEDDQVDRFDAMLVADLSKAAWLADPNQYNRSRASWCDSVMRFVNMFPNDKFSIKSDEDQEYSDGVTDRYEQVKLEDA
jgi:hypothetical protein